MRRRSLITLVSMAFAVFVCSRSSASAQEILGSAKRFAVLGSSTVTNTGPSVVTGDLGVSPGTAVTGFPPGIVNGMIHANDAIAVQGRADAVTAYDAFVNAACDVDLTGQDLGGLTLTPAVYCFSSSAQLTGALTLDALGSSDAVFLFQIGSTLTTAAGSSVTVINGGAGCNVFWQVGSSATLGSSTAFVGNILASADITVTTSASVSGRLLALNGAVTLDTNGVALCCEASWNNYGNGSPGTLGIPNFVASNPPVIGGSITLTIDNSSPIPTMGFLLIGTSEWNMSMFGGTLLVSPPWLILPVPLPVGQLDLAGTIPQDWALCGVEIFMQAVEVDAGASKNLSFTPGLELVFGI